MEKYRDIRLTAAERAEMERGFEELIGVSAVKAVEFNPNLSLQEYLSRLYEAYPSVNQEHYLDGLVLMAKAVVWGQNTARDYRYGNRIFPGVKDVIDVADETSLNSWIGKVDEWQFKLSGNYSPQLIGAANILAFEWGQHSELIRSELPGAMVRSARGDMAGYDKAGLTPLLLNGLGKITGDEWLNRLLYRRMERKVVRQILPSLSFPEAIHAWEAISQLASGVYYRKKMVELYTQVAAPKILIEHGIYPELSPHLFMSVNNEYERLKSLARPRI